MKTPRFEEEHAEDDDARIVIVIVSKIRRQIGVNVSVVHDGNNSCCVGECSSLIVFQFNQVVVEDSNSPTKCPVTTKLQLEVDEESKDPIIEVHKKLICKLKPHQVEGQSVLGSNHILTACMLNLLQNFPE